MGKPPVPPDVIEIAALVLILGASADGQSVGDVPAPDALRVTIEGPPPGPHYVGEAIPIALAVTAGAREPTITPPERPGVTIIAGGSEVTPISASAIGAVVRETNRYRFPFEIVPREAGTLVIPPFRVRDGDRRGASRPIRIEAHPPPPFGRPNWFLGGVGPLDVGLSARPEAIRLGEAIEVEVRLEGPGARGSIRPFELRGLDRSGLEPEVEPLPAIVVDDPPSRIVPYRVRPTKAGTATLAAIPIAWYDPTSRSYRTSISKSVAVRVDDPPAFNPSALERSAARAAVDSSAASGRMALGLIASAIVVAIIAWRIARHRKRSAAGRFARRCARRIARSSAEPADAASIANAMVGYLARANDRPEGALTPIEAREAVHRATDNAVLADRAERLIADCDAARFSDRAGFEGGTRTLEDAAGFFDDLAAGTIPKGDRGRRGPRYGWRSRVIRNASADGPGGVSAGERVAIGPSNRSDGAVRVVVSDRGGVSDQR